MLSKTYRSDKMDTLVRLEGAVEVTLQKLVELGYFKTRSEAVRAGILELGKEYNLFKDAKDLEAELVIRKVERINKEIDERRRKVYALDDVLKEANIKV